MAEKPIRPEVEVDDLVIEEAANVEIKQPGALVQEDVQMMEDGSAIVNPQEMTAAQGDFGLNLASVVEETELNKLADELFGLFDEDKSSRGDWEKAYVDGLDLLGFKYTDRTQPFTGASSVTHPLLAETVTQFQAQAYKELLPADGPVRTQIIGEITPDVQEQATGDRDWETV